ncbi:hypothetical protein T05_4419 [Trichinella murrelli]|uniref:Uncharacterized protein n=1 Tax=Trichinella murrelli TaxID=144512 RepID=A0A0V0TEQ0_9BILA|nr:hypothetical protein T05_4419 [Trichinella murrelli]
MKGVCVGEREGGLLGVSLNGSENLTKSNNKQCVLFQASDMRMELLKNESVDSRNRLDNVSFENGNKQF